MKSPCKRLLCLVLSLLMILSCVPAVGAEEGIDELAFKENILYMGKDITLEDDGTYTIMLESFVTGSVTEQPVPMDIVLVMDQSASMARNAMKEAPESVRFMTAVAGNTYGNLMAQPQLFYNAGDGYYYSAKVEHASGDVYALFTKDGSRYYTKNYSNTITTANGVSGTLGYYHCTDYQANFVLGTSGLWTKKYYYYNADNSSIKTSEFSSEQEAFNYLTTTYFNTNYSGYKLITVTSNGTTSTKEVSFCLPVDGFYWMNSKFTISYYKDGAWQTAETDTCDPWVANTTTPEFPTDVSKVTAQCNSENLYIYSRNDALQEAAYDFVMNIQQLSFDQGINHRIAVVGFGSGKDYTYADGSNEGEGNEFYGTELLSTSEKINYGTATTADFQNALQPSLTSLNVEEGTAERNMQLLTAIERIEGKGNTFPNYGLEMAQKILDNRADPTYTVGNRELPRKTIVILFTDGVPGCYDKLGQFADYDSCGPVNTAKRTVEEAKKLKDSGALVYSIGMLDGADPAASYNFTIADRTIGSKSYSCYVEQADAINAFLHFISSDYPEATDMLTPDRTTVVNNGYYYAATTANALSEAFNNISENVSDTTVTLTGDAIVRDVMSEGFDLPEGIELNPDNFVFTATANYLGNSVWENPVLVDLDVTINLETKTVDVTGFDYESNYVHEAYIDKAGNPQPAGGKMLLIFITGITANDYAIQNDLVFTNDPSSGIYENGSVSDTTLTFNTPTVHLQKKLFVLDYFAKAEIDPAEVGIFTPLHLSAEGMQLFSNGTPTTMVECANGTVEIKDGKLLYTPVSPDFHEADSCYLYGIDANGDNTWAKLTLLPANNVYYEDDWAAYSDNWTVVGTPKDSYGTFNNEAHGYIESKADELDYSNGSAHFSEYQYATAELTFTGTGIDIYTRTDSDAGASLAELFKDGELVARQVMDNESSSGIYYQIPTMFFHGLDYDTYTVKLTIRDVNYDGGRDDYYLDGYRVYNALGANPDATYMDEAYGKELNATYKTVRDLIITANSFGSAEGVEGVVFIDDVDDLLNVETPAYDSSSIQDYINYGPKNEVYLQSGNAIVLRVDPNASYYMGIKSPTGGANVSISYGEAKKDLTINSAADLYYEAIPSADGYIMIQCTSGVIALTKLRTCSSEPELALRSATADEILDYANRFGTLKQPELPTAGTSTLTKAPKQPKSIFRNITKPIVGREQK